MNGEYRNTGTASVCVIALMAGLGATTGVLAQENDNEPWLDLGQITLFGSGLETSVMESPASVTVIDEGTISRIAPASTADLLRSVPGVIIRDSGFERIMIRGEDPERVLIKIDGQALTDHSGSGTPILIDPTTIERIEVVRGASSVVSGSRAIGGVVNIITKRGGDKPFEGSLSAGYFSATGGYRTSLSLGGRQGAFDYRLSFGKSDMGDRESPDGPLVPSDIQDQSLNAHLGYTFGNHYVFFKAQQFDLSANVYTGSPVISVSLPKRDLTKYGLFYEGTELNAWISKLNFNVYHQTVDREFVNVIRPGGPVFITADSFDEVTTYGFNLDATLEFAPGHRTLVGLQYENDFVDSDKTTATTVPGPFQPPPTLRTNDARIETFSVYGEHEMEMGETLTGFLGARFYSVNAELEASNISPLSTNTDTRWLGSAGLVWTPREELALRVSLSQGYSYPTLQQLFMTTSAAGRLTTGNPNLKPENSTTLELGARFDNGNSVIDATVFYTQAEDYIGTTPNPAPPNFTHINVDGATSFGLELHAEAAFAATGFTPYVTATLMRRKFEYGSGVSTYDSGIPELFGRLGVRYDWELGGIFGALDAFVQGEGKTATRNSTGTLVDQTSGYATFNIAVDAELRENLHLIAGFNNLLDKSYDPVNGIPGAERNINLFLTYAF